MTVLFVASRLVLAATFLISASSKFAGGRDELTSALRLSVPRFGADAAAAVVTPLEFLVAALLLFGNTRTFEVTLGVATGLLVVFIAWMVSVLLRGLEVQCSCFGPNGAAVSWRQIGRNALLAFVGVAGLLLAPSGRDVVGTSVWSALPLAVGAALIVFGVVVRRAIPALVLSLDQVSGGSHTTTGDAHVG
ncbi:MAG TPA: MauE/DoxX family redox-associated membrane protein [Gaiellaceae bacterium]|nr:MauE/DoxX family redox-associated membrane protein [Gaiellaceae bacterium]